MAAVQVLGGGLPSALASVESAAPPPLSGSVEEASAAARKSGKPVEVTGKRTETATTYSNPDGSMTLEVGVMPQRVRQADGSWKPVDLSLRAGKDGVRPVSSPADVVLSGGGRTSALASFQDQGRSMALGWPGDLPVPTLSGNTATYAAVPVPGVDLQVTATALGFQTVLVVKNATAAKDPALAAIRFTTKANGVEVRSDGDNGVNAVAADGSLVFHADTPKMWDSATSAAPAAQGASPSPSASAAPKTLPAPDATSSSVEPGAGAHQAEMSTQVSADALTIVPDQAMLTSPSTKFPAYIDPSFTLGKIKWSYVDSSHPTSSYWNSTSTPPRVGANYDNTAQKIRSFFRMDVSKLPTGAYVYSSQFSITGTWSPEWSCAERPVQLWETHWIDGSETWNNSNALYMQWLDTQEGAFGQTNCAPRKMEFNAQAGAQDAADHGWNTLTLGLKIKASEEGDGNYWKRFDNNDPKLYIHYNQRPDVPALSQMKVEGKVCSAANPPLIGLITPRQAPTLSAVGTDPDGDHVNMEYEWGSYNTATKVASRIGNLMAPAYDSSGTTFQVDVPPSTGNLASGSYYFKTQTHDGWAADHQGLSGWSNLCVFTVDASKPDVTVNFTPKTRSGDTAPVYSSDAWGGGLNVPGDITLSTASTGTNDVHHYKWALGNNQPTTSVAAGTDAGKSATITVTPSSYGPVVLFVRAEDAAGNGTNAFSYTFNVNPPVCPANRTNAHLCKEMAAGFWPLADGTTVGGTVTTAQDIGPGNHPLTLTGAKTATGALTSDGTQLPGNSVELNPTGTLTGYGSTAVGATKVPILNTQQSFTVSAWVKLKTLANHNMVFVGQGGTHSSAFALYYKYVNATTQYWAFTLHGPDTDSSVAGFNSIRALSTADHPPVLNTWTHLVGTYDAGLGTVRLYVDDKAQELPALDAPNADGTTEFHLTWNAPDSFQIARGMYNSAYRDYASIDIQDVHAYPMSFSPGLADDEYWTWQLIRTGVTP